MTIQPRDGMQPSSAGDAELAALLSDLHTLRTPAPVPTAALEAFLASATADAPGRQRHAAPAQLAGLLALVTQLGVAAKASLAAAGLGGAIVLAAAAADMGPEHQQRTPAVSVEQPRPDEPSGEEPERAPSTGASGVPTLPARPASQRPSAGSTAPEERAPSATSRRPQRPQERPDERPSPEQRGREPEDDDVEDDDVEADDEEARGTRNREGVEDSRTSSVPADEAEEADEVDPTD